MDLSFDIHSQHKVCGPHAHLHIWQIHVFHVIAYTYTHRHKSVWFIIVLCTVPSDPVQNVVISNVIDDVEIAVSITWNPPTDPNGVLTSYRVQYLQISDPLDSPPPVFKRNIPLDTTVMNEIVNLNDESAGAPINITLSGLG